MKTLVNITNHPSSKWSREQFEAAMQIADQIIDIPFPSVPPTATTTDIFSMAVSLVEMIAETPRQLSMVLIQGEFTLTHLVVRSLMKVGVRVCAATSERVSVDLGDGKKSVEFRFVKFRDYI